MVMRIKRYEAEEKDLPKVIRQIKRDLGENAVVKTRRYKKGGVLGLGGKPMVEVYAGVERDLTSEARDMAKDPPISKTELLDRLLPRSSNGLNNQHANNHTQPVIYQPPGSSPYISQQQSQTQTAVENMSTSQVHFELQKLAKDIADIRKSLATGTKPADVASDETRRFPRWLEHLKDKLIANEASPDIVGQMMEETLKASDPAALSDFETALSTFQRTISTSIEARGSLKGQQSPRILSLAGPTGVGKTTTLAKLAATANLLDKLKVGLISADTYRIAAIDQLKTFAGILDIPIKVVFSPAELREAMKEFSDCDKIFIDTAGRSPNNDDRIEELRELVGSDEEIHCHLVISATTRPRDMQLICDRFRHAGFSRFIITKIDETCTLGPALSMMYREGLPASYLTNGQSVPDDIILGEESDLLSLVIRRSMT